MAILLIILYILLLHQRKRSLSQDRSNDPALATNPFILPCILRMEAAKMQGTGTTTHTDLPQLPRGHGRSKAEQRPDNATLRTPSQNYHHHHQDYAARVIVHVDSEDLEHAPEGQAEVVELPPSYRSVPSALSIPEPLTTAVIHIQEEPIACSKKQVPSSGNRNALSGSQGIMKGRTN
ncbi:hypothetical protein CPB84DRAFT_1793113 [Gymnopilus junonius]|uniref:Uncharacterized protein n=1 Tax=Gymnopilus junonius TaxID=109634 RepID=A0A9P5NB91_GYMJU|nr:hypothetical protein CPB84DRAFT_1793113 [Gymnopilus junonius]